VLFLVLSTLPAQLIQYIHITAAGALGKISVSTVNFMTKVFPEGSDLFLADVLKEASQCGPAKFCVLTVELRTLLHCTVGQTLFISHTYSVATVNLHRSCNVSTHSVTGCV
jgi:hypothetical protein